MSAQLGLHAVPDEGGSEDHDAVRRKFVEIVLSSFEAGDFGTINDCLKTITSMIETTSPSERDQKDFGSELMDDSSIDDVYWGRLGLYDGLLRGIIFQGENAIKQFDRERMQAFVQVIERSAKLFLVIAEVFHPMILKLVVELCCEYIANRESLTAVHPWLFLLVGPLVTAPEPTRKRTEVIAENRPDAPSHASNDDIPLGAVLNESDLSNRSPTRSPPTAETIGMRYKEWTTVQKEIRKLLSGFLVDYLASAHVMETLAPTSEATQLSTSFAGPLSNRSTTRKSPTSPVRGGSLASQHNHVEGLSSLVLFRDAARRIELSNSSPVKQQGPRHQQQREGQFSINASNSLFVPRLDIPRLFRRNGSGSQLDSMSHSQPQRGSIDLIGPRVGESLLRQFSGFEAMKGKWLQKNASPNKAHPDRMNSTTVPLDDEQHLREIITCGHKIGQLFGTVDAKTLLRLKKEHEAIATISELQHSHSAAGGPLPLGSSHRLSQSAKTSASSGRYQPPPSSPQREDSDSAIDFLNFTRGDFGTITTSIALGDVALVTTTFDEMTQVLGRSIAACRLGLSNAPTPTPSTIPASARKSPPATQGQHASSVVLLPPIASLPATAASTLLSTASNHDYAIIAVQVALGLLRHLEVEAGPSASLTLAFQLFNGLETRNNIFLDALCASIAGLDLEREHLLFAMFGEPTTLVGYPTAGNASNVVPKNGFLQLWTSVMTALLEVTPLPFDALAWCLATLCYTLRRAPRYSSMTIQAAVMCATVLHEVFDKLLQDVSFHVSFALCLHYLLELFDMFFDIAKPTEALIAVLMSMFVTSQQNPIVTFLRTYARRLLTAEDPWGLFGLPSPAKNDLRETADPLSRCCPSICPLLPDVPAQFGGNSMHGLNPQCVGLLTDSIDTLFWPNQFCMARHRGRLLNHFRCVARFTTTRFHAGYINMDHGAQGREDNKLTAPSHPIDFIINPVEGIALVILSDVAPASWFAMKLEVLRLIEELSLMEECLSPLLMHHSWVATYTRYLYLAFLESYHSKLFAEKHDGTIAISAALLRTLSGLCQSDLVARNWAWKLGIVRTLVHEVDLEQSVTETREKHIRRNSKMLGGSMTLANDSMMDDTETSTMGSPPKFLKSPSLAALEHGNIRNQTVPIMTALLEAPMIRSTSVVTNTSASGSEEHDEVANVSAFTVAAPTLSGTECDDDLSRESSVVRAPPAAVVKPLEVFAIPQPPPLPPSIASPKSLPFVIPKLSLSSAPPPLYYTSNGDTGAVVEATMNNMSFVKSGSFAFPKSGVDETALPALTERQLHEEDNSNPSSCPQSRPLTGNPLSDPNNPIPTANGDDEELRDYQRSDSFSAAPSSAFGDEDVPLAHHRPAGQITANSFEIASNSISSNSLPSQKPTQLPAVPTFRAGILSTMFTPMFDVPIVGGPKVEVVPIVARPPFAIPKLSLSSAPPPLYYTSNGDTGAVVEATMNNMSFVKSGSFAFPKSGVDETALPAMHCPENDQQSTSSHQGNASTQSDDDNSYEAPAEQVSDDFPGGEEPLPKPPVDAEGETTPPFSLAKDNENTSSSSLPSSQEALGMERYLSGVTLHSPTLKTRDVSSILLQSNSGVVDDSGSEDPCGSQQPHHPLQPLLEQAPQQDVLPNGVVTYAAQGGMMATYIPPLAMTAAIRQGGNSGLRSPSARATNRTVRVVEPIGELELPDQSARNAPPSNREQSPEARHPNGQKSPRTLHEEEMDEEVRNASSLHRSRSESSIGGGDTYPLHLLMNEAKFAAHQRSIRRVYLSKSVQAELLHLILILCVGPYGTLDPSYVVSYTVRAKKMNALFYLHMHMNHDANAQALHLLRTRLSFAKARKGTAHRRGCFLLLQLIQFRTGLATMYDQGEKLGTGGYGTVYSGAVAEDPSMQTALAGCGALSPSLQGSPLKSFTGIHSPLTSPVVPFSDRVAIKQSPVPHHIDDRDTLVTFFNEVAIMAALQEIEGVVPLLDCGCNGNQYVIVVPQYRLTIKDWRLKVAPAQPSSPTLHRGASPSFCNRKNNSFSQAVHIFSDIMRVLCDVHDKGAVHHDLKLDNVFLDAPCKSSDAALMTKRCVVIGDWGESELFSSGGSMRSETLQGSPGTYSSSFDSQRHHHHHHHYKPRGTECIRPPEALLPHRYLQQFLLRTARRGEGLDLSREEIHGIAAKADVWGAACLLYELMTGEVLFGEEFASVIHRVTSDADELLLTATHRAALGCNSSDPDVANTANEVARFILKVMVRDPLKRMTMVEARQQWEETVATCGWEKVMPDPLAESSMANGAHEDDNASSVSSPTRRKIKSFSIASARPRGAAWTHVIDPHVLGASLSMGSFMPQGLLGETSLPDSLATVSHNTHGVVVSRHAFVVVVPSIAVTTGGAAPAIASCYENGVTHVLSLTTFPNASRHFHCLEAGTLLESLASWESMPRSPMSQPPSSTTTMGKGSFAMDDHRRSPTSNAPSTAALTFPLPLVEFAKFITGNAVPFLQDACLKKGVAVIPSLCVDDLDLSITVVMMYISITYRVPLLVSLLHIRQHFAMNSNKVNQVKCLHAAKLLICLSMMDRDSSSVDCGAVMSDIHPNVDRPLRSSQDPLVAIAMRADDSLVSYVRCSMIAAHQRLNDLFSRLRADLTIESSNAMMRSVSHSATFGATLPPREVTRSLPTVSSMERLAEAADDAIDSSPQQHDWYRCLCGLCMYSVKPSESHRIVAVEKFPVHQAGLSRVASAKHAEDSSGSVTAGLPPMPAASVQNTPLGSCYGVIQSLSESSRQAVTSLLTMFWVRMLSLYGPFAAQEIWRHGNATYHQFAAPSSAAVAGPSMVGLGSGMWTTAPLRSRIGANHPVGTAYQCARCRSPTHIVLHPAKFSPSMILVWTDVVVHEGDHHATAITFPQEPAEQEESFRGSMGTAGGGSGSRNSATAVDCEKMRVASWYKRVHLR